LTKKRNQQAPKQGVGLPSAKNAEPHNCSTCAELWESEIDLEVMEAAAKHPKAQFRLTLSSTYDCSGSKRTALFFSRIMKAVDGMRKNSNKAVNVGWEIYKKYS